MVDNAFLLDLRQSKNDIKFFEMIHYWKWENVLESQSINFVQISNLLQLIQILSSHC